ncbi:histidine phosphatase family protein [Xylanimonas allomyrinae]|uniref:Histidine phosphatase family protein n=1 Tax=Xylanimonas allomyrinae TaxID=2509459 RepID=A0A4P6EQ81_9MICO|nr:histidine phosphatase family protein [Xylanimonas allomyrinae]QAY62427.1 histidine phosphatase family protein [Xylanimonas allomyrinae]
MSARRLVLLRHAKAEPGRDRVPDEMRPLTTNGRNQATRVGKAFAGAGLVPDLVLVSTALRTRQTWELLSRQVDDLAADVQLRAELYEASVADVLDLVREADDGVGTVLVVGHEPTMAAAAAHLAGPGSDDAALAQVRVGVPTATYSILESDSEWAAWGRSGARLLSVARP